MKTTLNILAINPGSTSTKISLFENEQNLYTVNIKHSSDVIAQYDKISDQYEFRENLILEEVEKKGTELSSIDVIVARGGNMKPVKGGTYKVNAAMVEDLRVGVMGQHASNLGGIIADAIARQLGVDSYVVDPVVVDEFEEFARVSGMPAIERKSKDHPLNQKAAARIVAKQLGGKYEQFNFVVVHMGGGISVGAHKKGKVIDVNNALDGDGPFSPERSGGVPIGSLVDLCFSGQYTKAEIRKMIVGNGGLTAYLGTNDGRVVEERVKKGDEKAAFYYEAMAYQIAKEVGAASCVLKGDVDAVVLTGGLAYDKGFCRWIQERVEFIAPVKIVPGENEMEALVQGVLRVYRDEEPAKEYI